MTTHKEALMLAREYVLTHSIDAGKVFIAIEEALAQPEHNCTRSHPHDEMSKECELRTEIARLTNELARLKAQPKEPEQEPVAWMHPEWRNYTRAPSPSVTPKEGWTPLYTPPPQRTWVGLTDEDIDKAWHQVSFASSKGLVELRREYARALEAKLKEKNT